MSKATKEIEEGPNKEIQLALKNGTEKQKKKIIKLMDKLKTITNNINYGHSVSNVDDTDELNPVPYVVSSTSITTIHNTGSDAENCSYENLLRNTGRKVAEIQLFKIGGEQNKKKNYYDEKGFIYSTNNSNETTKYYRCKNFKKHDCNARVIVRDDNFEIGILTQPHKHEPNQVDLDRVKFSKKLEEICRENPFLKAQDIYDGAKVALRKEINMIHIKEKRKYDSFIHRKQKQNVPLLAKTIEEFEELINNLKYAPQYLYDEREKLLYRGVWRGKTGNNVVFISDTVLDEVRRLHDIVILMDGTFKSLPSHLNFRQLYIISVIIEGRCYPLAYILMEKKDTGSYELIFNNIKSMIPKVNVYSCMSDYEAATRKALKKVFPKALIHGCYFHYVQAIVKAFKRFGLKKDPKFSKTMEEVSALALLPNELILLGFEIISRQFKKSKRWNRFSKYWLKQWAPANISVYGLKHRTNNFAESLNKTINLILKSKRPHIWRLIHNLKRVEMNRSDELKKVVAGDMTETRGNNEMKRLNAKIEKATARFNESENVKAFLKSGELNKKIEKDVKTFLLNVTFNEKSVNFFKERIEVAGGADTEDNRHDIDEVYGLDYDIFHDFDDDDDEGYDDTIIPNDFNIVSNIRQNHSKSLASKRKGTRLDKNCKKSKK